MLRIRIVRPGETVSQGRKAGEVDGRANYFSKLHKSTGDIDAALLVHR